MSASAVRGGKVAIEIGADLKRFYRALDAMQARVRAVGSQFTSMGQRLAGLGAIGAMPFAAAIKQAATFEDTLAALAAVSGVDRLSDDFQSLQKRAMELGASTSFTAQQVAEGMGVLAQGGFTATETLGAIEGVLNLARSGMMDLAQATDIAVSTLRAFKMPAESAGKVADVLAKASSASNATIQDLGVSLSVVSGIASSVGVSLEEVSAMLGVLADRGQKGSVAGTALRRILQALASEGDKLGKLGVEVKDPNTGKLRPVLDILDDLRKAMEGMDDVDKLEKLTSIFDVFGANAIVNLLGAGDASRKMLEQLQNSAGVAGQVASDMDNTLGGSFRMFASAAEALGLQVGMALTPVIRDLLGVFQRLAAGLADWVSRNQEAVVSIAKWVAATAAAGAGLIAVGGSLQVVAFAMKGLTTAASLALAPLGLVLSSTALIARSMSSASTWVVALGGSFAKATVGLAAFAAQAPVVVTQYAAAMVALVASTTATAVAVGASWAGAAVAGSLAFLAHIKALVTYYTGAMAGIVAITIKNLGVVAGAWISSAGASIAAWLRSVVVASASYVATLAGMVSTTIASTASMAAAWLAPVAPILAAGAAIAGIGMALSKALGSGGQVASTLGSLFEPLSAGFNKVLADATRVFSDLWRVATTTFAGISDAVQAGDLSLAFEIAWAGIKAAWLRGQEAIMSYVDRFVGSVQDVWGQMTMLLAISISQAMTEAEKVWIAFSVSFTAVWQAAVNKVLDIWDTAVGAIQKAIAYIRSFFDDAVDYDAIKRQIDDANKQRKDARDASLRETVGEEGARRMQDAEKRGEEAVRIIVDDERKASEARAARTADRAAQRGVGSAAAEAEVGRLRERAAATREGSELAQMAGQANTVDDLRAIFLRAQELVDKGLISQELMDRIEAAVDAQSEVLDERRRLEERNAKAAADAAAVNAAGNAVAAEADKADAAGTFSADAARGLMFSSNLAERTAKATEETARNTRNMGGAGAVAP